MPRASDGTHSLPPGTLVSTGDTVLVSQHNPAMQDLSQSITNSLDRDGKGGMRTNLQMGGNRIVNMADGVNPTDAATVRQLGDASGVPLGAVIDYFGPTPPPGYLFPVGQAISRGGYAALFALIGTTFGAGDGSTTFNLPDYRGRVGAGRDNMGDTAANRLTSAGGVNGATLGAAGGAQTHTLTAAQMPSHSHTVSDPGHTHAGLRRGTGGTPLPEFGDTGSLATTGSATTGITLQNTGDGQAHPNVQPTIVCNKIMRVQ